MSADDGEIIKPREIVAHLEEEVASMEVATQADLMEAGMKHGIPQDDEKMPGKCDEHSELRTIEGPM